ncbi:KH domain-containing protein [Erysipelotrichaceae bacterium OttesenSCG-928-M19]|nr:KH domain-containing protein [Erysipelotrichaceae bacterium OttesenSCG-928-M19]
MKDYPKIVKAIITPLVEDPSSLDVNVMPTANDDEIKILVIAHEDQIPRLIGKQGRNANAIRQLVRAAASEENKKILVDFESF